LADPLHPLLRVALQRFSGFHLAERDRELHRCLDLRSHKCNRIATGPVTQNICLRFELLRMPICSRYLATVRRAMSMPPFLSSSTIFWSECGRLASSPPTISLILDFTAWDARSSPLVREMPDEKKNLSSKMPCGVWTY